MRDMVRTQLDLDDVDLPDELLDNFLQDGYDRAIELEDRWPFFETMWSIPVLADGSTFLMPDDARRIEMLMGEDGRLLRRISPRLAMMSFPVGKTPTGTPTYWSRLNRNIFVYPKPGTDVTYSAIGYRQGDGWQGEGAGAECDCDRRLHLPIVWYACSLGYAQQEDEVLEATYMKRFMEGAAVARDIIMRPNQALPHQVGYTHYPSGPSGPGGPAQIVIGTPPAGP